MDPFAQHSLETLTQRYENLFTDKDFVLKRLGDEKKGDLLDELARYDMAVTFLGKVGEVNGNAFIPGKIDNLVYPISSSALKYTQKLGAPGKAVDAAVERTTGSSTAGMVAGMVAQTAVIYGANKLVGRLLGPKVQGAFIKLSAGAMGVGSYASLRDTCVGMLKDSYKNVQEIQHELIRGLN